MRLEELLENISERKQKLREEIENTISYETIQENEEYLEAYEIVEDIIKNADSKKDANEKLNHAREKWVGKDDKKFRITSKFMSLTKEDNSWHY